MSKGYCHVYKRFVNVMRATEGLLELPEIGVDERHVLKELALQWSHGERVTVLQFMELGNGMSSTSVFRYLKKLTDKGYLQLEPCKKDARVKYIKPSKLLRAYHDHLGQAIIRLAQEHA